MKQNSTTKWSNTWANTLDNQQQKNSETAIKEPQLTNNIKTSHLHSTVHF